MTKGIEQGRSRMCVYLHYAYITKQNEFNLKWLVR